MDEIFARRDLIEPALLRALSTRSDRAGFLQLGSHLCAMFATGLALYATLGTLWAVPIFIAHGILINFLYAAQHEMSHWTVFRTRWLNEAFGRVIGFMLLYPRDFDQVQHYAHHRHTQDWQRDGELGRAPYGRRSYLLWLLGPSYWYSRIARIIRFCGGVVVEPYIPAGRRADMIREARWHLAGYATITTLSIALGSWAAVTYWLAPMVLTKAAHQLQNTIEHLGLPHVPDTLRNTRSTRTGAALRWLCWNMQYHTAHHAFPGVPLYQLPELHRCIFTARGREPPTMTYLAFQWAVLHAFARGKTEVDYPRETQWIAPEASRTSSTVAS